MRRLGPRVFFLVFFAYTLTVSIFIQVPFMFYNDEEGLDAARKESGPNDASGVVWAHRYVFKCFYFLFIFIFYYYDTQRLPHPLACKCESGMGIFIARTRPHPPRSHARAEGGFPITHHRRPTAANTSPRRAPSHISSWA